MPLDADALWRLHAAVVARPSSETFYALGLRLRGHDEPRAARAFGRAIALAPRDGAVVTALGEALLAQGQKRDAERCQRHALRLLPTEVAATGPPPPTKRAPAVHPSAPPSLRIGADRPAARASRERGGGGSGDDDDDDDDDDELTPEQLAASLHMERAEEHSDRAEHAAAIRELQAAVALVPWHALPYANLAAVQGATRQPAQLKQAVATLRAALAGGLGDSAMLHVNLAVTLSNLEREAEASPHYLRAAMLDPAASPAVLQRHISARWDECDWRRHAELGAHLAAAPQHVGMLELSRLGQPQLALAAARARSETHALEAARGPHTSRSSAWRRAPSRSPLRLAYLSADLLPEHPIGKLLLPLLACHDPQAFHVTLFSSSGQGAAEARRRLAQRGFALREVDGGSAASQLAAAVAARRPHLAVELNSHTRGGRLDAMARRPAPAALTFLGYTGTSGATFVDTLPADRVLVPPTTLRRHYSEQLLYLPHLEHVCHHSLVYAAPPPTPLQLLRARHATASSWNSEKKVGPDDWHVWANVARRSPGLRLQQAVSRPTASGAARLRAEAHSLGLASRRLGYPGRVEQSKYFARIAGSHLTLDTPRWNGVSSSLDVLWAGSPLLTLPLQMMLARMGAALLGGVAQPQLACGSWRAYEDAAGRLLSHAVGASDWSVTRVHY